MDGLSKQIYFYFFLSSILAKEWVYKIAKATDFNETQLTLSIGEKKKRMGGNSASSCQNCGFLFKDGWTQTVCSCESIELEKHISRGCCCFFPSRKPREWHVLRYIFSFPFSFWIFFSFVFPFFFKFISTIIEMVEKSNPNCLQRQCWTSREQSSMIGFSRVID